MTKDEFHNSMGILTRCIKQHPNWDIAYAKILKRDIEQDKVIAEQRRVIEQQAQQISRLENGLGCSRSHPHEDMNQICELRTEVARLKNELSHWTWVRFKQLEEENATLREALGKLIKEIYGILGIGEEQIRNIVGNTNVNVLHVKIATAQQALKEVS